jgi:hypothetical protein
MTAGIAPAGTPLAALDHTVHQALTAYWELADTRDRWMRKPVAQAFYATKTLLEHYNTVFERDRRTGAVSRSTRDAADDVIASANTLAKAIRSGR